VTTVKRPSQSNGHLVSETFYRSLYSVYNLSNTQINEQQIAHETVV